MESQQEMNTRLNKALANSTIEFLKGHYDYEEFDAGQFNNKMNANALVLVRDGSRWCQLVNKSNGTFAVLSIHFNKTDDVKGFIGWFANYLREKLNIGLITFVGINSTQNGIYDYYGVPFQSLERVEHEINLLRTTIH